LAECLLKLDQPADAATQFERLRERFPEDVGVRVGLARCERLLHQEAAARQLLDELVEAEPDDPNVLAERARLERDADRLTEAEDLFRRAVEHPPYEPEVLLDFALVLERNGKAEEAATVRSRHEKAQADRDRLKELRLALAETPTDVELNAEMGQTLMRLAETDLALPWLEAVLRLDPSHQLTRQTLADYWEPIDPQRAAAYREPISDSAP
jgi:predicted Zn-dependent protease